MRFKSEEIKNVFDFVRAITESKKPWSEYSDAEKAVWNNYMVLKCLSFNPDWIEFIDVLNGFWSWEPDRLYKCLCDSIPSGKYYFKYIKTSKSKYSKELKHAVGKYYSLSSKEIEPYLEILSKEDKAELLKRLGFDEKEVKTMLK